MVNVLLPEYTLHIHYNDAGKLKKKNGHPLQLLSFTNKKSDRRALVAIDNVFGSIILQKKEVKQQEWETVAYDIVTADSIDEKIRKHYDKKDRGINIRNTPSCPYTAINHNGSCGAGVVKVFLQYAGVIDKSGKILKKLTPNQKKVYNAMNTYMSTASSTMENKTALQGAISQAYKYNNAVCDKLHNVLKRLKSQNDFHKINIMDFFKRAARAKSVTNPKQDSFTPEERKFSVAFQKECKKQGLTFSNNHKENKHGMRSKSVIDFIKTHHMLDGTVIRAFQR